MSIIKPTIDMWGEIARASALEDKYGGDSLDDFEKAIASIPDVIRINRQAGIQERNSLKQQVGVLDSLSQLIRDEDSLVNFEKVSSQLSTQMKQYPQMAATAMIVDQFAQNKRDDYNTYVKAMESGAKILDNPNFIQDQEGWDNLDDTVKNMTLEGAAIGESKDHGVFQVNDSTFAKYDPANMSEEDMIKFSSDIVYGNLDEATVGDFNDNNGWNNWSVYKNKTDDFKLASGKNDEWFIDNGITQKQLKEIDKNFKTPEDRQTARAVMYAESKGDHSAVGINKVHGTAPKYKGNGTLLWITEQQNKINSIMANVQSASKGSQFRYNKAGGQYTDQAMIEKLSNYQQQLGVAVEAAIGDGVITEDEAEFIMLGNLDLYQSSRDDIVKKNVSQFKNLDKVKNSLVKQINEIKNESEGSFLQEAFQKQLGTDIKVGLMDAQGDGEYIDTDINVTTKDKLLRDLNQRLTTIHGLQLNTQKAFKAWTGRDYWEEITPPSNQELEDLSSNIMIDSDSPDANVLEVVKTLNEQGKYQDVEKTKIITDKKEKDVKKVKKDTEPGIIQSIFNHYAGDVSALIEKNKKDFDRDVSAQKKAIINKKIGRIENYIAGQLWNIAMDKKKKSEYKTLSNWKKRFAKAMKSKYNKDKNYSGTYGAWLKEEMEKMDMNIPFQVGRGVK